MNIIGTKHLRGYEWRVTNRNNETLQTFASRKAARDWVRRRKEANGAAPRQQLAPGLSQSDRHLEKIATLAVPPTDDR